MFLKEKASICFWHYWTPSNQKPSFLKSIQNENDTTVYLWIWMKFFLMAPQITITVSFEFTGTTLVQIFPCVHHIYVGFQITFIFHSVFAKMTFMSRCHFVNNWFGIPYLIGCAHTSVFCTDWKTITKRPTHMIKKPIKN